MILNTHPTPSPFASETLEGIPYTASMYVSLTAYMQISQNVPGNTKSLTKCQTQHFDRYLVLTSSEIPAHGGQRSGITV